MRYIDAENIEYTSMCRARGNGMYEDCEIAHKDQIDDIPTADVRENVKAHWINMKPTGDSRFMCSRCKCKEKVPTIMGEPIVWDYCPNCGADMRGEA